ncbi:TPA: hypothetical protein ACQT3E_006443, partial [Pseudomonas aeruginosa]
MSLHRIRVMVADDHPAISLGISYELSQCGSLEMLGQVSNSTELIGRLNEGDCDVVIVGRRQKLSATPDLSGTVLPL